MQTKTRIRTTLAKALFLGLLLIASFVPASLSAQLSEPPAETLNVALAECPPFVIINEGQYSGLAVYLWEQIGAELGLSWNYTEYSLGELLQTIRTRSKSDLQDVSISCASVTSEREELIDFSHSFTETYTAIAVRETSLWSAVKGFLTSPQLLKAVFIVIAIAALIGAIFYWLEGRINKKLFSSPTLLGRMIEPLIIGLMFITNGPIRFYRFKTLTARSLATILTLSSTFLIAAVTAVLASSFTLSAMQTEVRSLGDLRNMKVGALSSSTSSAFLTKNDILHVSRPDLATLVRDLDSGELDAIVSDAAFLRYHIAAGQRMGEFQSLTVLPYELAAQNYAFILKEDSRLREPINRALLEVRTRSEWRDKVSIYQAE